MLNHCVKSGITLETDSKSIQIQASLLSPINGCGPQEIKLQQILTGFLKRFPADAASTLVKTAQKSKFFENLMCQISNREGGKVKILEQANFQSVETEHCSSFIFSLRLVNNWSGNELKKVCRGQRGPKGGRKLAKV